MKSLAIMAALIPALSMAQSTPDGMMYQALQKLGLEEKVTMETTGAELRGRQLVNVRVILSYHQQLGNGIARVEVMTFEDGKLVSRQAGDGNNIWDFDARSNMYSSSTYASDERGLFQDWKQRFFQTLKLRTSGVTAYTVRQLDDAFGLGLNNGKWVPWIPISKLTKEGPGIVCHASSPAPSETKYTLSGSDEDGYTFEGSEYNLFDSTGNNVVKHWTTTISPGSLPRDVDFGFVPPRGARAKAVEQRSG